MHCPSRRGKCHDTANDLSHYDPRAAPWTPLASALIVTAYSGGAIMPQVYVTLKPFIGFQSSFALFVIPSCLAVFFYARHYGQTGLLPLDQTQ